ncbi:MAG: hypothetical protein Q8R57_02215, partial [Bacteroidota bacterium]|nr:hypothetical protein [Bacteroidota bacterium]
MKNIVILSIIFISILFTNLRLSAQPGTNKEEFNRKRHWVGGTYGHPYTMFDRYNGKTFTQTIQNIRFRIKQEYDSVNLNHGPVFKAYQLVYNHAMLPRPLDNGIRYGSAPSALALWAKNNTFVMLVGLNGDGKF